MKRVQMVCAGMLLNFVLLLASPAQAGEALRPEVGKPMQAAQELIKAHKYKDAMAKIREAETVSGRTAYENYIIERMRATAAAGAGDTQAATQAFESLINGDKLPAAERLQMMEALAGTYYRAKDYAKTASWVQKYHSSGGTNPQMRLLLVQSLYLGGNYAAASKELSAAIAQEERAGGVPAENLLLLQASSQQKNNDAAGYLATLERLIRHYPKAEYWGDVIGRVQGKPGFPDRLLLDVYRLRHSSGNLSDSNGYVEFAQLALQEGYPAEAQKIVSEGFDKKLLGAGADAQRHQRLRDMADRMAREDRAALDKKARTGEKDGNTLVNDGYAWVTYGELRQGVALIENGIGAGGLKRPEEAWLHLGLAHLQAGNKAKAAQAFKAAARSGGGVADLARLWMLLARLD